MLIGVTPRTVKGYANDPIWHNTLDVLGYIGDRTLTHKTTRSKKDDEAADYKYAEYIYKHLASRLQKHPQKIATFTEKLTQIPRQKIRRWAREGKWRESGGHKSSMAEDLDFAKSIYKREKQDYNHTKIAEAQMSDKQRWLLGTRSFIKNRMLSELSDEKQHCISYTAEQTKVPYQQIRIWQEAYEW